MLNSDLIWDVLAGGIPLREYLSLSREKLPDHLAQDYNEFSTRLESYFTGTVAHNSQNPKELYFKGMSQILFRVGGGTFFATDTEYVGNAADTVREDDIVCPLHGCSRFAVL